MNIKSLTKAGGTGKDKQISESYLYLGKSSG